MPNARKNHENAALVFITPEVNNLWQAEVLPGISRAILDMRPALIGAFTSSLLAKFGTFIFAGNFTGNLKSHVLEVIPNALFFAEQPEIDSLRQIFQEKNEVKSVAIFYGIHPLFDTQVYDTLFQIHQEYQADCSFTENAMPGITPYIFSKYFLETLDALQIPDIALSSVSLQAFIEKNLNKFHVEIHFEFPDLRLLREDFSCKTSRSLYDTAILAQQVGTGQVYQKLSEIFATKTEILYSLPSYIEIEPYSGCTYTCIFCPRSMQSLPTIGLSEENFSRILQFIEEGFGDTSVCLGGWGEPLEYGLTLEYIKKLSESKSVRQIILETNGFLLQKLLPIMTKEIALKLKCIVNVNSLEKYAELHGAPEQNLLVVKEGIAQLCQAYQKCNVLFAEQIYLQVLKINENYTEIDSLFDFCEKNGISFLLQKYNSYTGKMPERRVSDMTPLEKSFCWHLRRDLFISAEGNVQFCKQYRDASSNRGNIENLPLTQIWSEQKKDFCANYLSQPPPHLACNSCDEFYTFNA